ncbi:MAG: hypothetical protein R8N24_04775 [Alphaproteobacteria bacterium]|nr:hypothetical protein [Alphaproteobacteria bacterium]
MKLANVNSVEMSYFFAMLFNTTQQERDNKIKLITEQEQHAARLHQENEDLEAYLENDCNNYMEEQETRSDILHNLGILNEIEKNLQDKNKIIKTHQLISKINPQYNATIYADKMQKKHHQTQRLANRQNKLVTDFNNMCARGIKQTDFDKCRALFTQYNEIATALKQRTK